MKLFTTNRCAVNLFEQIKRTLVTNETTIDNQRFARGRSNFEKQCILFVGDIDFPRRGENQRLARREIHFLNGLFNQVAIFFKFHVDIDTFANVIEGIFDLFAEFLRRIVTDDCLARNKADLVHEELGVGKRVGGSEKCSR